MKKYIVWILMIAMILTLCACRSEAQTGGAGSPTESVGETEENVGRGAEVDENAEDTETGAPLGAQGEESAENTLIPEESEEGSEVIENEPAENEEEAEVTLPATTTEDPALRAEADRIRKEQGEEAYQDYCIEKDMTIFSDIDISHNFENNKIIVRLKRSFSEPNKAAPDFSCIKAKSIEEWMTFYPRQWSAEEERKFSQWFIITLEENSKQGVIDAIRELEKLDYVLLAEPNYLDSPC